MAYATRAASFSTSPAPCDTRAAGDRHDQSASDEEYSRAVDANDGVPIDESLNVVDENTERPVDRMMRSLPGAMTGAAMLGLAKGMGMHHEVEETAEIRELGEPEPDPDDPIEVKIDLQDPQNSRIVYHVVPKPPDDASAN